MFLDLRVHVVIVIDETVWFCLGKMRGESS
jgi:hypothetical protein